MIFSSFFKLIGISEIFWLIRCSDNYCGKTPIKNIICIKIVEILSYLIPKKIIYVSNSAKNFHNNVWNFSNRNSLVVHNGVDTNIFKPVKNFEKYNLRKKLNIPRNAIVIGTIGRADNIKNHKIFIETMLKLYSQIKNLYVIVCGSGVDNKNYGPFCIAQKSSYREKIIFLSEFSNIPKLYNIFDIFVLTSYSEGMANVLLEACASEVVSLSTNVGDANVVLSEDYLIMKSEDLKSKIEILLNLKKNEFEKIGKNLRNSILKSFSYQNKFDTLVEKIEE